MPDLTPPYCHYETERRRIELEWERKAAVARLTRQIAAWRRRVEEELANYARYEESAIF